MTTVALIIAGLFSSGLIAFLVKRWAASWAADQTPEAKKQREIDAINKAVASGKSGENAINLLLADRLQRELGLRDAGGDHPGGQTGDLSGGGREGDDPAGGYVSGPAGGDEGDPRTLAAEVNRLISNPKGSVPVISASNPQLSPLNSHPSVNTTD